jgi:protease-4
MSATKVILLLLAFAFIAVAVVIVAVAAFAWLGTERVPRGTLLEVDLEQMHVEHVQSDPISQAFFPRIPQVRDVVDALAVAAEDDKVVGLIARVGSSGMGLARLQEIRDAILDFRASGKLAVAYAETFGELAPGNGGYYLATAFDEIHLQPSGDVGLTGLIAETPFLKGTFEKMGIEAQMDSRREFKNALNTFTETELTEAHAEAARALIESQFGQLVRGIAEQRSMEEDALRALIDRGPFYGQEAVDAGLVDGLAYRDEVYAQVRERTDPEARLLYLGKYLERRGRPHQSGTRVALIYGTGAVVRGEGGFDPLTGSAAMGSDRVSRALRDAIDDDRVEAIVFRVDSPGGSYVASDTIWRETVRARDAGKPVIVSMGDLAASGGYFVSAAAEKIVAQPGTITGSIGVFAGKLFTDEMWGKIGMTWDEVHTSDNATMWSSTEPYSTEEWSRLQAWLDRVYEDFTGKVAAGREMSRDQVLEIAKGRVWTGEDAKELGLVDELGGLETALELTRAALALEPDAELELELFPEPRSPFQQLFGQGPDSSEEAMLRAAVRSLETLRPLVQLADRLGLLDTSAQPLRLPEMELAR